MSDADAWDVDARDDRGPWNDRGRVVVRQNTPLPDRCVRCGRPGAPRHIASLRWQPAPHSGGIAGAIDRLARTEFYKLQFSMCVGCKPRIGPKGISIILFSTSFLWPLAGVAATFIFETPAIRHSAPLIGLGVMMAFWIATFVAAAWPTNTRIVARSSDFLWLAGVGEAFCSSIQDYQAGGDRPHIPSESEVKYRMYYKFRFVSALIGLAFGLLACLCAKDYAAQFPYRNSPVVSGQVVAQRELSGGILAPSADFTIRLADGATVHATTHENLVGQLPETVRVRCTSNPNDLALLEDFDVTSPYLVAAFSGGGIVFAWSSVAGFRAKKNGWV